MSQDNSNTPQAEKIQLVMDLRRGGISDTELLAAVERTPRELFLPEILHEWAYDHAFQSHAEGEEITPIPMVAKMLDALQARKEHRVLEIGTGTGYQAAVLSRLCKRLYTMERHQSFLQQAEESFKQLDLQNITTRYGDGSKGWPGEMHFDRILVNAAANNFPPALIRQLSENAVMVMPIGLGKANQKVFRITKQGTEVKEEMLFASEFGPLFEDYSE